MWCYRCVMCVRLQRLQAITCGQGLSSASLRRVHTTPNTMTNLVLPMPPGPSECLICSELALLVLFCPCQHSVACEGEWWDEAGMQPPLQRFLVLTLIPCLMWSLSKQSVHIGWRSASNARSQSPRKLGKVRTPPPLFVSGIWEQGSDVTAYVAHQTNNAGLLYVRIVVSSLRTFIFVSFCFTSFVPVVY